MKKDGKKKIYKRWWFWIIIVVIIIIIAASSGGNSSDTTKVSGSNSSSNVANGKKVDNTKETPKLARDNSEAKETSLGAGTFVCGSDITPGRYVIKSEDGTGNFIVYKGDMPVVNEVLGQDSDMGVKSITVDLEKDEKIKISGINKVEFKPAVTKESDTLTTGEWTVGLDIAPGRYVAEAPKGSGNFVVYKNGIPQVNEILDASGEMGVKNVTVSLTEGEKVNISGLNSVKFTKK